MVGINQINPAFYSKKRGSAFFSAIFLVFLSLAHVAYGETSVSLENDVKVELMRRHLLNEDVHDSVVTLANGAGTSIDLGSGFDCLYFHVNSGTQAVKTMLMTQDCGDFYAGNGYTGSHCYVSDSLCSLSFNCPKTISSLSSTTSYYLTIVNNEAGGNNATVTINVDDCTVQPPPSPPPGAGEYQSSDTKSCTQEWNHLKCDSKVTMTSCVATTDCVWDDSDIGDEYCFYKPGVLDGASQVDFDWHYADRDYTSRDDIGAMPSGMIALCGSKGFQACTGDCVWRMIEANDYDTDGIYEREGQCYPGWPLVKAELESNGAPAGTVGHWSYLSYSLQYCVAETETACQDIAGCVWGGESSGCHGSFAVRAKSIDAECSDIPNPLGFDQFYDASTPSLSDSTSGACAVFNTVCAIVVVFTSVILQVLR